MRLISLTIQNGKRREKSYSIVNYSIIIVNPGIDQSIYGIVQPLSHVWLFVTPWTVACQAPLSRGFPRQEILEWVDVSFSRVSSQPSLSCTGKLILYQLCHLGSPQDIAYYAININNKSVMRLLIQY